jgi:hypothetical protein
VRADDKVTAFVELETAIRASDHKRGVSNKWANIDRQTDTHEKTRECL